MVAIDDHATALQNQSTRAGRPLARLSQLLTVASSSALYLIVQGTTRDAQRPRRGGSIAVASTDRPLDQFILSLIKRQELGRTAG